MPKVYVYLICTEDLKCKIGRSANPLRRLGQIQNYCPLGLELVLLIELTSEGENLERYLHKHYKKKGKHIHGEWFQLAKEDLRNLTDTWPDRLEGYLRVAAPRTVFKDVSEEEVFAKHEARVRKGYSNLWPKTNGSVK